ncbi:DUF2969 domain-containing protein [Lentilactobacillus sp. SPB1-3]|uniref:DUF2969 domain-containing protein n=1 Tax=Lentilactobacillus terminaliae TaxID=3003483 RepID=A0ACD5DD01_9LACO|nr:DUF2969 domain-containing protein [Lentilactobacillus sp. SPB1-3]MCZ0977410.1 DUF2969 domain-containing protein [Lentilactobacillus sp. SPB1-3]
MSKANKSINVDINDTKNSAGQPISELMVGKDSIGSIRELEDNKFEVINLDQDVFHVKSFDEGVTTLIKHFNLHH